MLVVGGSAGMIGAPGLAARAALRAGSGMVVAAALVLATACTNKQGETESPVFITVTIDQQPGFIDVGTIAPVQLATINLASHLKNPAASDPAGFADTEIQSYTVTFRRTDGGTLVPPVQTFGAGILVPSGGVATLSNFPVLAASAMRRTRTPSSVASTRRPRARAISRLHALSCCSTSAWAF